MDDNNVHTSVVIELANSKEESEGQNSYHIEIDDMNTPKDYVIDQIFCGENVTVYALFEVPEGESRNSDKNYVKVNNQNNGSDKTFDFKETYKKVEKKINGYKQNSSPKSSEEYLKFFSDAKSRNKSLYCLKHPSGTYDLIAPDQRKSDLRVLYSKNFALEDTKSTKFKAISVGVNTDIVQCPKILEEVQKVLGLNVPLLKFREKMVETSNYFSTPSSEITEIETRQSLSSFASATDSRVSNLFFVPLLMMEDDSLSKFSKDDSTQKSYEKDSKNLVLKVSLGINTDESEFGSGIELNTKRKQNTLNVFNENSKNISQCSSDQMVNEKLKLGEKRTILKEIKTMQSKLSALIEQIESSSYESDDKIDDPTEAENKKNALEKKKNFDERPILLTWNYFNEDKPVKNASIQGTHLQKIDSVIDNDIVESKELIVPEIKENNEPLELKISTKIRWKSSGSSKSETSLLSCSKYDTLKNSSSLNFKNVKSEVFKNLFISEANSKKNLQRKTLKNNVKNTENLPECELGDDLKRNLSARTSILNSSQDTKKQESSSRSEVNIKKSHNEEEGDAKSEKAQLPFVNGIEKPQTSYIDPNITVSDGLLSPKRSLHSCRKDSKSPDKTTEAEKKTCSDSEKPETPNVNVRKIITTHSNVKKDFKTTKKTSNRHKVAEATTKVDIPFRRILTGCRVPNKNNGESKLHINKLIKAQGANNGKTTGLTKNTDEKPAAKPDRIQRPSSQKQENRPPTLEVLNEAKEHDGKNLKPHVETSPKKLCNSKTKVESGLNLEKIGVNFQAETCQKNNPPPMDPTTDSSSVVVKLLSKKPESIKDFCSEISEEYGNGNNVQIDRAGTPNNGGNKNSKTRVEVDNNLQNMEKSIVKSVWALTKVLLFEDGTKKLEVLEASLTPPGYSLNQSVKAPK